MPNDEADGVSVHWEIGAESQLILLGVDDDTSVAGRRLRNR